MIDQFVRYGGEDNSIIQMTPGILKQKEDKKVTTLFTNVPINFKD